MIFPPAPQRSVLELLWLLDEWDRQRINDKIPLTAVLMLSAQVPQEMLIANRGRVYLTPANDHAALKTASSGCFLTTFWDTPITLGGPLACWCYDALSSEFPLARRFSRPIAQLQKWVQSRWPEVLYRLDTFREKMACLLTTLGHAPPWEKCPLCSPHRASWFGPWPYDDDPTINVAPVRQWYLPIIGAPLFNDNQSRGWCLKKCLHCASIYHWKSDYEYLVNGASESSDTLTRLTPEEAVPWLQRVQERLAAERSVT